MKKCKQCEEVKPFSEFQKNKELKDGHINYCNPCRYQRYYRERNSTDSYWDYQLKWKYGISLVDFDRMVVEQDGVCAVCSQPNGTHRLCVDHCHETKKVRGLLCTKCNKAIGMLGDTAEELKKAYDYLLQSE